ncbi:MAG: tetratricopeptide repeat protein [Armatimonadota bacterium]
MKSMRLLVTALCAIALSSAFAQGPTDVENAANVKVVAAAEQYNKKTLALGDAIATFEGIVKEFPMSGSANGWLGFLYLKNNEAKKAVGPLEVAYAANKKDTEVLNNLANAYFITDQKDKALLRYNELIVVDQASFEPYYNLGNIHIQNKDWDKAILMFTKAGDKAKDKAFVVNNLGVAQEGAKKFDAAAATFSRASDMDPKNQTYARNAGALLYRLRKHSTAATYLERALKAGAQDKQIVLALGDCYAQGSRTADMEALYSNYESMFASDFTYNFNIGVMKKNKKDYAGAEMAFRKALSLRDSDGATLGNLGVILFNKGEYAEARELFEKLSGIDPSAKNKKNFAAAAARSGDVKSAMPIWMEMLRLMPSDIETRLLVADAQYEMGNTKEAMTQYKSALATKGTSSMALDGVGRCHLRDANYAAAEAAFRSAIAADAKFVPAYNNLAVVLEKMNKRPQAIIVLERAATIDPNNSDVAKNLKRMKAAG